jgi:hypothetical protein
VSIVRVGLSETERFATGYEVIFGSRRPKPKKTAPAKKKPAAQKSGGTRKKAKKKKS